MIIAQLQRGDGLGQKVWLRSVVRNAQLGLVEAGHAMEADGKYGTGTARIVREFQGDQGIPVTGSVDAATWRSLRRFSEEALANQEAESAATLDKFHGDLYWVHLQEGHRGRPYWPGGVSGVTLDPGVDLGHATAELVESVYGPMLTATQMRQLRRTFGLKGQDAKDVLREMPELRQISISHEQALAAMPLTARPYWDGIRERFRVLSRQATPASVQTVLLSLAYNRGIRNQRLEPLAQLLQANDWAGAANAIGRMQQNHQLEGIRRRRRQEAAIIRAELELLAH